MKDKLTLLVALCLVLAVFLASCDNTREASDNTSAVETTPLPEPIENASFADNLMTLTASDGNRMISPYSAKMCLALLANGADGETKTQILDAIGISDLDKYNSDVKALLERYATYAGVMSLETANSLWLNKTVLGNASFSETYANDMQNFYSAEIRDVESKNSIEGVNEWVNEKTKEKIPEILDEGHRNFASALINAVYFKAPWQDTFDEHLTDKGIFNNKDGTTSELDFMHDTAYYEYCEADTIKAIKIDYGRFASEELYISDQNYDFSMYIMLGDDVNVDEFLNKATFESKRVALSIPKFEFEYSLGLTDILKALGIVDAFDEDKANLGKMIDLEKLNGNLFVSDVLQKTYIGIDENGTEAAAVTAIVVNLTSALINQPEPIEFKADRPFYFAIRDNTSGDLLFVGRYETAK